MTPAAFIAHWQGNPLTERAGAQAWFCDLCDVLGVDKPRDAEHYCFERGAKKAGGGEGWADVWKRGCFGWENKRPGRPLEAALKQLTDYSLNLENPPLLVVSDRERIILHTAFTGYPDIPREIRIDDLIDPQQREILRWVFTDPEKLKPSQSFKAITEAAAAQFARLAERMRARGEDGQRVAHFLVQCLFCLFAEDEHLLPANLFADLLKHALSDPGKAGQRLRKLFTAMQNPAGEYGDHDIAWFNGGLFQVIDIPPLTASDLTALHTAAREMDWRDIDPTIFGTLFERGLDPAARAPLGAHYTDPATIGQLIDPVLTEPLLAEWAAAKALIEAGQGKGERSKAYQAAKAAYPRFLLRLSEFRVLDPACGSGNFLYLALKALRDVEKRVAVEARDLGHSQAQVSLQTGPHNLLGLEINDYAAELARVTVWIGDIQWCRRNGYQHATDPILPSLAGIEHRDALLNPDGTEAAWPVAEVIVGNPPFLGGSKQRRQLGGAYFAALNAVYADRVPGGADLVCYWFEKARAQIASGQACVAGLVATNSIRGGANRRVLERIVSGTLLPHVTGEHHGDDNLRHPEIHADAGSQRDAAGTGGSHRRSVPGGGGAGGPGDAAGFTRTGAAAGRQDQRDQVRSGEMDRRDAAGAGGAGGGAGQAPLSPLRIFTAWSDAPWINDGAAVRVSLVCFGSNAGQTLLNGQPVAVIHADLTGEPIVGGKGCADLTGASVLKENALASFQGSQKIGAFDLPGEVARSWLGQPNPNRRSNAEVLEPCWNGLDATRRPRDTWIVDFGTTMSEGDASLYELPFQYVVEHVKPERIQNPRPIRAKNWWRHGDPQPAMRDALKGLSRYIATPEVSKHRVFIWMDKTILPDKKLIVIARADDTIFGILQSRIHEVWALAVCTWHGVGNDPRYTPTTTFWGVTGG